MSAAEDELAFQLKAAGITGFEREVRFHPTRRWRFDFAHDKKKVAVEIEGLGGGRHQRTAGFIGDIEKYEEAVRLGWNVYRTTAAFVKNGRALETIEILLKR